MNNCITTKSIAKGITEVEEDFILSEKPMSRLVFRAQIHNKGIKGKIIRQRRESATDKWAPEKAIDIRSLGKNETINLTIDTKGIENFYLAILKLVTILRQKGVKYGENKYAVVDPDQVIITDDNKVKYIRKMIEAGYGEEVWNNLAESNPSLVTKLSYARIQSAKKQIIDELETRLSQGGFSETSGNDSWQKWIYKNNWLFGVNYQQPIEKAKININGIMPDYLFPTIDGFVDILEIKLPEDDVIVKDTSHNGSWKWSLETNTAIGQVVNYLSEIDRLRLEIEKNIKDKYNLETNLLKPRAYILIGNSNSWGNNKKEGLRKMNHALHGIEVITYKELIDRGNQYLKIEL
jgi:hypothetical protein